MQAGRRWGIGLEVGGGGGGGEGRDLFSTETKMTGEYVEYMLGFHNLSLHQPQRTRLWCSRHIDLRINILPPVYMNLKNISSATQIKAQHQLGNTEKIWIYWWPSQTE